MYQCVTATLAACTFTDLNKSQRISWTHLTDLYGKSNFESGLSLLPKIKIKREHLYFSRMWVNLAAQVRCYCLLIL